MPMNSMIWLARTSMKPAAGALGVDFATGDHACPVDAAGSKPAYRQMAPPWRFQKFSPAEETSSRLTAVGEMRLLVALSWNENRVFNSKRYFIMPMTTDACICVKETTLITTTLFPAQKGFKNLRCSRLAVPCCRVLLHVQTHLLELLARPAGI